MFKDDTTGSSFDLKEKPSHLRVSADLSSGNRNRYSSVGCILISPLTKNSWLFYGSLRCPSKIDQNRGRLRAVCFKDLAIKPIFKIFPPRCRLVVVRGKFSRYWPAPSLQWALPCAHEFYKVCFCFCLQPFRLLMSSRRVHAINHVLEQSTKNLSATSAILLTHFRFQLSYGRAFQNPDSGPITLKLRLRLDCYPI